MSTRSIEDVINEKLTGDTQAKALDLVIFMRENGFTFEGFESGNDVRWTPSYEHEGFGCIAIAEEAMLSGGVSIAIWLGLDCGLEKSETIDDELKDFTWSKVVNCPQAEHGCDPPYNRSCIEYRNRWLVFGKEFESTCHSPLAIFNLDDVSLANVKKLLLLIKQNIDNKMNTLEDEIKRKLSGDMQKNALDLVSFLRSMGMTNHAEHTSAFEYNGEWVCILVINDGGWMLFDNPLTSKFDDFPVCERLKEFAWAHVNVCTSCGGSSGCGSQPGRTKIVFGKEFDNVCTSEVAFFDPGAGTLENVKQMIEIWMKNAKGAIS